MNDSDKRFTVEEDDVRAHAPITFECLRRYYARIRKLGDVVPDPRFIYDVIADTVKAFGVLPEGEVVYEDSLLDFESFRLTVIFHLCISIWLEEVPEWEQYIGHLDILEKTVSNSDINRSERISIQSTLLKLFSVSPAVLPKGFVQASQALDEMTQANSLISDEVKKIRPADDGFVDYSSYFEYMRDVAGDIIRKLQEKEMYSFHEPERFAAILISMRNSIPTFDIPYDTHLIERTIMATESMIQLQRKILAVTIGLDPGEEIYDEE